MAGPISHLYFHIPFCASICPYCSFHVETPGNRKSRAFLDALLCEVEVQSKAHRIEPRTIYFGGGTPTMLSPLELEYLLTNLTRILDLSHVIEWTFEVNPATLSRAKAALLRRFGVNRLSIGVQSWNDRTLALLGRNHSAAAARETFAIARDAGFQNLSIDLMFGVPGQTREEWQATLDASVALQPEHVSAYCLTYEEDTAFFEKLCAGEFKQDEARDVDFFEITIDTLERGGFQQYEISNYARPGFTSLHNRAYWQGADYLGIGPSAFSTVGAGRWQNIPDSAAYTARIAAGELPVTFREHLSEETKEREVVAFSLRTAEGVSRERLTNQTGAVLEFSQLGLLVTRGDHLVLTRRGKLLADSVAEAFV